MKKKEVDQRFIRWLIEVFAKEYHLQKYPVRQHKQGIRVEGTIGAATENDFGGPRGEAA